MAAPLLPTSIERATEAHAKGNRLVKDAWALYAGHRTQLTQLIIDAAPPAPGQLVLLGAGYCNDVDLEVLATHFATIHLVDIDAAALAGARQRAPAALRPRLMCHAPVDLTGLLSQLDRWKRSPPTTHELDAAIDRGVGVAAQGLPLGQVDVVASCCALTQLSWGLSLTLGDDHFALADLRRAVMIIHARTMAAVLRPGGTAVIATDIISSDHFPLEDLPPDTDLSTLVERVIVESRYYAGANPRLLGQVLRKDPVLAPAFEPARKLPPWLWTGRMNRTYLVYALALTRR